MLLRPCIAARLHRHDPASDFPRAYVPLARHNDCGAAAL